MTDQELATAQERLATLKRELAALHTQAHTLQRELICLEADILQAQRQRRLTTPYVPPMEYKKASD